MPREELATGTRIVTHSAMLGGVTSDGYVLFVDLDADKHTSAKIIPLAGGTETKLVSSTGTGKDDLRFAIAGKVVFVWSDRGNRVATLTMWSQASGVVTIGPNVRPGRAAATSDGLGATDDTKVIAKGTENVEIEIAKNLAVFSFAGSGDMAGVWVAPLDQ